jgi:hypothetical protein
MWVIQGELVGERLSYVPSAEVKIAEATSFKDDREVGTVVT